MNGNIPPWVMRFVKQTGKGINHHEMINSDDNIMLGISGGKDSLALAFALALRKRWLPVTYNITAVHIEWVEFPMSDKDKSSLQEFFSILKIPYYIEKAHMYSPSFKTKFNCYLCSRNRKRILFNKAEDLGINKIALGHNLDDIVETSLINLCLRGNFSTMLPVQEFFKGKIFIIRPMCEVKESIIERTSEKLELPVFNSGCPYTDKNIRSQIKPIIQKFSNMDKFSREHIYNAHFKNIIKTKNS